MRWHITGADTKTGKETTMTVEASTEAQAEQMARYNGVLVSSIVAADALSADSDGGEIPLASAPPMPRAREGSRSGTLRGGSGIRPGLVSRATETMDVPAPAPAAAPARDGAKKKEGVPHYYEIVVSAKWLNGLADFVGGVGWVHLLAGAIFLLLSISEGLRSMFSEKLTQGDALGWAYRAGISAFWYLVLASVLRMIAALGHAIRDMARNSFRPEDHV